MNKKILKRKKEILKYFVGNWESQEIQYIICPDCGNEIILTPLKR